MHPLYFAKLWIMFDGDLWKLYKFSGGNTSVAQFIRLHKTISKKVDNFPKIKIRTPRECWPEEFATEIDRVFSGKSNPDYDIVGNHYQFKREFVR